jgi:hypothetical protein
VGIWLTDPAPDQRARQLALSGGGLRAVEAGSAHRGSAAAAVLSLVPGCVAVRRGVRVTNPNRGPSIWPGERIVGQLGQAAAATSQLGQTDSGATG